MWPKTEFHFLLWLNSQWPCNFFIPFKNFLYPHFFKFLKKKKRKKGKKEKEVSCLGFLIRGRVFQYKVGLLTKNQKLATTYFHAVFFFKKNPTFKWRSIIFRWSCLGVVTVNKSKKLQFDRTVFGHSFSNMGHLSLPTIQFTSDNSRQANPSSDIQTKHWRGRTSPSLCSERQI